MIRRFLRALRSLAAPTRTADGYIARMGRRWG